MSGAAAQQRKTENDKLPGVRVRGRTKIYAPGGTPVVGAGGIEPPNGGIKIHCLTAWLRPKSRKEGYSGCFCSLQWGLLLSEGPSIMAMTSRKYGIYQ